MSPTAIARTLSVVVRVRLPGGAVNLGVRAASADVEDPMRSLFLAQPGAYLRYHDLPGQEPACVYLAGLGGGATASFPPLVAHPGLAGRRSLLVDPLGFGYSDRPQAFSYTLEDHARTVAALVDHLGLAGCALFGWSWGGSIAIALATLRPELVGRLVLAEANLEPGAREGSNAQFSRSLAAQTEEDFLSRGYPDLLNRVWREMPGEAGEFQVAADPRALHRSAVSLVIGTQPTLRESFLSLPIPRVYVFGEYSLKNADMAERAEDLPKHGVRVLVVPHVGHDMGIDENPAGFAEVLRVALTGDT